MSLLGNVTIHAYYHHQRYQGGASASQLRRKASDRTTQCLAATQNMAAVITKDGTA